MRAPPAPFPLFALLVACGGAAHPATTPHATPAAGGAPVTLAFQRITIEPTGASFEVPGRTTRTVGPDVVPGRPATLNIEETVDAGGLRFTAAVHDFVAHEIPDPEALAQQIVQAVSTQFQVTPRNASPTVVSGVFVVDATFQSPSGQALAMRIAVGRTRVYHPFVVGPADAMQRQAADVERFLGSILVDPDDLPWATGDGRLTDGAPWAMVHPPGWGLSVDMPGAPAGTLMPSAFEGAVQMRMELGNEDSSRGFLVLGWHYNGTARPPRDAVETLVHGQVVDQHGTVREDRTTLVSNTGARRLTVDFPAEHKQARVLIVAKGQVLYELTAVLPENAPAAAVADAERFLASFHITG